MLTKTFRALFHCSLFFLLSCGGNSQDGEIAAGDRRHLAGVAEDGPIAGARIMLIDPQTGETVLACGASGRGRCEAITAADGTFDLFVRADLPLDDLEIITAGGYDPEIGNLGKLNIRFRAPLALFAARENELMISPVTSILAAIVDAGAALPVAEATVRRWLSLPGDFDLARSPSVSPVFQGKNLLVTEVAMNLAGRGDANPFGTLAAPIAPDTADTVFDAGFLLALGFSAEKAADAMEIAELLLGETEERKKGIVQFELKKLADQNLAGAAGFDADDPVYRSNLELVAKEILLALGSSPLTLVGERFAAKRLARFVLFKYGLLSDILYTGDGEALLASLRHPETGDPLRADPFIPEITRLEEVYSIAFPLFAEELPGNDNQKRIAYYFGSELSPFYQAERVNLEVFDDDYSDTVMQSVAIGLARAGLLSESRAIIGTQIFQMEVLGYAYLKFGDELIDFNRPAEATAALQEAEVIYRRLIATKGYLGIDTTDANRLQRIGLGYRRAGAIERARGIFAYLAEIARALESPSLYGRVIVGSWQVADQYLAEGRGDLAAPLVDFMYELALATPPNVTSGKYSYKARIFYLVETAKRYAELQNVAMVEEIYRTVQAIRTADGLLSGTGYLNLTAGETWVYMVDFVELLYQLGEAAEAYALAEQMPAAHAVKAYKLVATYEGVQNGLPAALTVIDGKLPLPADQIEALTYYATNQSREYLALALIERNLLAAASAALDRAMQKIAALAPGTDADRYQQLIQFGYVKIAGLYALAGDPDTADFLLREKAEPVLATIQTLKYRVDAMTAIALGYHGLSRADECELFLARAAEEIAASAATVAPPIDPAARAKLYLDYAALYETVLTAGEKAASRALVLAAVDSYLLVIRQIFDPTAVYAGTDHDTYAGKEVDKLLKAAEGRHMAGDPAGSGTVLDEAREIAREHENAAENQIWVAATRRGKMIEVIAGYAAAGQFEVALTLARGFATAGDRQQALQKIALTLAGRDDFPATDVAQIDTDHDGRPDFFNPLATAAEIAASGLILDDDCDGDGIPDIEDRRPLFPDTAPF